MNNILTILYDSTDIIISIILGIYLIKQKGKFLKTSTKEKEQK